MNEYVFLMSEEQLQATVVEFAELLQYRVYHVARVKGHLRNDTAVGFPDLIMVKAPRVVVVECKSQKGTATAQQLEWIAAFAGCTLPRSCMTCDRLDCGHVEHKHGVGNIQVFIWRPSDWLDGGIERVLRGVHDAQE